MALWLFNMRGQTGRPLNCDVLSKSDMAFSFTKSCQSNKRQANKVKYCEMLVA